MKNTTKILLTIAVFLVVFGLIMFTAVMFKYNWDFSKLSTVKYETNTYDICDSFSSISMNTDTADIIFELSNDKKCRVVCYEEEKANHSVIVKENTLTINLIKNKEWYDYIGINFNSPKIIVYLPNTEYNSLLINEITGNIQIPAKFNFYNVDISSSTGYVDYSAAASDIVKIKTSTGNIRVENSSVAALNLSVSTGEIMVSNVICRGNIDIVLSTGKTKLNNIKCKNLISSGSTGNISLNNVICSEKFSIKRSTGDVNFNNSDANEIFVETDTGEVVGNLLTDKVFITHTDTGRIQVPKTTSGGLCEVNTDTGDIIISVK